MSNETSSNSGTVLVTYSERTATVAMNRPEAMNALNPQMLNDFIFALKEVSENEDVDVVILKGNGNAFSAGGDIKMMLAPDKEEGFNDLMDGISELVTTLYFMPKLTISAIHGAAAGLGLSIALATDHLIADSESKVAMNFIGIGLIPDGGGHFFLERRLGEVGAKELIWEGRVLTALEAKEKGLIHEIADGTLEQAVERKVQGWLKSPVQAMIKTKKILSEKNRPLLIKMLEIEKAAQFKMRQTADHQEGIKAFVEKRRPNFIGK
ncbi:enoyl-CoA hydratase [Peribacillus butanolivorans]|uniref:enoyl-CoA hydratase n=1 Tax=Peribacillus butanolivorans TaxID=421767 RepID=UPI0006A6D2A2|nr:enoyl-CoA hydratase [Peribacillus butanolivorans]KON68075.1 enoyl-CoA hydratase [Peribacillus butanolivorans]